MGESSRKNREDALVISDASLVRRFNRGEEDAATQLYLRYVDRLISLTQRKMSAQLAVRLDAEDVVQSVFRTFFRRASEGLFEIPAGDQLWQLLLVIAINKVRHLGRFHRRERRDIGRTVTVDHAVGDRPGPSSGVAVQILEMVVRDALADLPAVQRTMIEMRIQGFTAQEIADATQRSSRTVERVLRRFRDTMQDYVEEPCHVDDIESH